MRPPRIDNKGLEVRLLAAKTLEAVFDSQLTIEEALDREPAVSKLEARDRAFLVTLLLTSFRHLGEIQKVIGTHLAKPLPRKSGPANLILWLGAAQLLFLDTPPHAAIDLAVQSARMNTHATHFSGLINAVLRKVSAGGKDALQKLDAPRLNTPDWLWKRWRRGYGEDLARLIAGAHGAEPALDLAIKNGPVHWAEKLGGTLLPGGHVRLAANHGAITGLPGFSEGAWWVQDAAAGMPVLLFGNLKGKSALDLCAAPGGKTLQMAAAGATVTAVDISAMRLQRLRENIARIGLEAEVLEGDVLDLGMTAQFHAVLLDAPCSATGTIRRHPELPYLKNDVHLGDLISRQREMMMAASERVCPGGMLVYATCSLEPEEGEEQVGWFLSRNSGFELAMPPTSIPSHFIAPEGWLRILPHMSIGESQGLDGFFAAGMRRLS
jgi:16S rRNA (cytosine967-C5)-methyltransferase